MSKEQLQQLRAELEGWRASCKVAERAEERYRLALSAIRGACPPGICTLAEYERFARETARAALEVEGAIPQ